MFSGVLVVFGTREVITPHTQLGVHRVEPLPPQRAQSKPHLVQREELRQLEIVCQLLHHLRAHNLGRRDAVIQITQPKHSTVMVQ